MEQDYSSHRRWVPAYHFILSLLILATVIGAVVNLVKSVGTSGLYSASLILAISLALIFVVLMMRTFPLRAQDRAIRAEENLRHYVRTGKLLDPRLDIRQIIGLRFASDEEYDELAARAVSENLTEDDIKKSIRSWRSDTYRV